MKMNWPAINGLKRLAVETRAAEVAEFAAVLPILIMLLIAVTSFARAYNVYTTINYAAQEGARTANSSTCATCNNTSATASDVSNRIAQVLQASRIDPSAIRTYTGVSAGVSCSSLRRPASCSDSGNVHVCTNVVLDSTPGRRRRFGPPAPPNVTGPEACGSTVSFEYPFQFNLPFTSVNAQIVTLKADAQLPSEN